MPVGSPYVVKLESLPVVGLALFGLASRSTLWSLSLFPTLTILVILLEIAWRTPTSWIASIMVIVYCVFTGLTWNSTRTCNICLLPSHPFLLQQHQTPVSIAYTAKILPGVIILYDSLVYAYIFLGVIPVDKPYRSLQWLILLFPEPVLW